MDNYLEKYKLTSKDLKLLHSIYKYKNEWIKIPLTLKLSFIELFSHINFLIPIYYSHRKTYLLELLLGININFYSSNSVIYLSGSKSNSFYIQLTGVLSSKQGDYDLSEKIYNEQLGQIFNYEQAKTFSETSETLQTLTEAFVLEVNYAKYEPFCKEIKNQDFIYFSMSMSKFRVFDITETLKDHYQRMFPHFKTLIFRKGDVVIKQGKAINRKTDGFYFIISGSFLIQKKSFTFENKTCSYSLKEFIKENKKQDKKIEKFYIKFPSTKRLEEDKKAIESENKIFFEKLNTRATAKSCTLNHSLPKDKSSGFKYKTSSSTLACIGKLSIFGDIDFFTDSPEYTFQVICKDNDSMVYFISYEDFDYYLSGYKFSRVMRKDAFQKADIYNYQAGIDNYIDKKLKQNRMNFYKSQNVKKLFASKRNAANPSSRTFYPQRNAPKLDEDSVYSNPHIKSFKIANINTESKLINFSNKFRTLNKINEENKAKNSIINNSSSFRKANFEKIKASRTINNSSCSVGKKTNSTASNSYISNVINLKSCFNLGNAAKIPIDKDMMHNQCLTANNNINKEQSSLFSFNLYRTFRDNSMKIKFSESFLPFLQNGINNNQNESTSNINNKNININNSDNSNNINNNINNIKININEEPNFFSRNNKIISNSNQTINHILHAASLFKGDNKTKANPDQNNSLLKGVSINEDEPTKIILKTESNIMENNLNNRTRSCLSLNKDKCNGNLLPTLNYAINRFNKYNKVSPSFEDMAVYPNFYQRKGKISLNKKKDISLIINNGCSTNIISSVFNSTRRSD